MRQLSRWIIMVYALLMGLVSALLLLQLLQPAWAAYFVASIYNLSGDQARWWTAFLALLALLVLSALCFGYALLSTRMSRARLRSNAAGSVEIGVEAIESVALNATKAAQAGVKNAKARAYQGKGESLKLLILVQLYSDVEIPAQMLKIQDRVKKDVERYTGIVVSEVHVKVRQVEQIGARVER